MGANLSVEEKVFKCAKSGDAVQLQSIIRQLQAAGANVPQYLEFQDATGITPLIVACKSYDYTCVDMLLRHGVNLHHFSKRPEGTTALHEAVARGNLKVAELLLQYGANPFMENGRGLTCVDLAINKGNTAMVRSLELRSNFTGTLQLKVSKYMGLGAEWKSRWVVIMPRYQMPANPNNAGEARVARSLLVCYKTPESCEPVCKVWLDGAVARSVTGSRGSGFLQCALSLHRSHALAGGALMTGDAATGYTMHLRPPDGTAQGSVGLRRFMEIVNGSRMVATPDGPSQSSTPTSGHSRNSSLQRVQPAAAAVAPHLQPGHTPTQSDEELARYLQQQYDAEAGGAPVGKRPPSPIRNPQGPLGAQIQHGYPPVGPKPPSVSPTVTSQQLNSRPSAPLYPNIDLAASSSGGQNPQAGSSSRAQWYPDTVQAQAPPTSSAGPLAEGYPAQSATTPAPVAPVPAFGVNAPGQGGLEDDEAGNCVICMDNKATAGFLHGDSVHKCCCKECATDLKAASTPAAPLACPMCRKKVEHVIFSFY